MGENEKTNVADSAESGQGTDEVVERPVKARPGDEQASLPLFLRNRSEGDEGNAQDEKDEMGE
jgi:hypothetical protein